MNIDRRESWWQVSDTSNVSPQKSSARGTPRKMSACEKKNACAKAKQYGAMTVKRIEQ